MDVELSKSPLDTTDIGYQPPEPKEERSERPFPAERTDKPVGEPRIREER